MIGFSVSSGLLLYSGKELVNSLIYLAVVVFLPLLFSVFSIFTLFFKRDKKRLFALELSYLFGLFFSIGALTALLFTISVKDIAFGWATTLNISAEELSSFLNSLAVWKSFCSSCIVSEHLAKISQIIRLGGKVAKEQIAQAKELGAWWRYLALAIITYGIIFRAILYAAVKLLNKKDILTQLRFEADKNEETIKEISNSYSHKIALKELLKRDFRAIGYHTSCDLPNNTEAKDIVVCVKSWEPPIMDFFDFLEELKEKNRGSKITIYLKGLDQSAKESDVDIWLRKLNELKIDCEVAV